MKAGFRTRLAAISPEVVLTICATNAVAGTANFVLAPEAQEVRTGREKDSTCARQYGVCDDSAPQAYVSGVAKSSPEHAAVWSRCGFVMVLVYSAAGP